MNKIEPIQLDRIPEVKEVILKVCQGIFQVSQDVIKGYDNFSDLDDIETNYFLDRGIFLVLVDDNKIVGSGGIKRFNNEICELKRMRSLKEYRSQGAAKNMSNMLFDFAKKTGYKKMRLDLISKEKQAKAIKFYRKLGFDNIERYNDISCNIFM